MKRFECTRETPWGIHAAVRNDQDCPRCDWTAPGPIADRRALAAAKGWTVIAGGPCDQRRPETRAA